MFFAFIGFDIVATMAEETKNPQRDVPRGILASLAIVTVLYVAVSVVLSGMVSYTQLKTVARPQAGEPGHRVHRQRDHTGPARSSPIGALAGLTTVVMVLMLGQCRVLFAMARDGLLPRQLAKTGSRGTPVRITVLVAVVVAATASVFPISKLEEMVNVGTLFAFVLVSAGVIVLRRTRPGPGARVPGPVGAAAADRVDLRVRVADAQPHRADLGPVRRLAGGGHRDLPRLRATGTPCRAVATAERAAKRRAHWQPVPARPVA